jgi:hypothetical protein
MSAPTLHVVLSRLVEEARRANAATLSQAGVGIIDLSAIRAAEDAMIDPATRMAPVQRYEPGIPWAMHLEAYAAYSRKYGPQQALIEGWCRGGFSVSELDYFIPGWRERLPEAMALRAAAVERDAAQATLAEVREESARLLSTIRLQMERITENSCSITTARSKSTRCRP